jgi:hypothetical protein
MGMSMTINLTREQFYDLVWSEPKKRLSQQVGISDVAISKHCRKAGIPVPERGYWNKLHAGKLVKKTPLPERDLGTINHVSMSGELPLELHKYIQGEPGVPNASEEPIELLTERFRKRLGTVTVPRAFSRTHPAIATLLRKDEEYRIEAQKSAYSWRQPKFDAPFERRRLRIINGLFLAFAGVDGGGWIRGDNARDHSISLGDKSAGFSLDKNGREGRRGSVKEDDNRLYLKLTHHRPPQGLVLQWQDEDNLPLENQLTDIVVGMAVAAEHFSRQWVAERIAWDEQCRVRALEAKRKQNAREALRIRKAIAAARKARSEILLRHAEGWRMASVIRDYVAAVGVATGAETDPVLLDVWSEWALAEANRLDPIKAGRSITVIQARVAAEAYMEEGDEGGDDLEE